MVLRNYYHAIFNKVIIEESPKVYIKLQSSFSVILHRQQKLSELRQLLANHSAFQKVWLNVAYTYAVV